MYLLHGAGALLTHQINNDLKHFLRRCIRLRLYRQHDPNVTQLVEDTEDKLFINMFTDDQHVLFYILPDHHNGTEPFRSLAPWNFKSVEHSLPE